MEIIVVDFQAFLAEAVITLERSSFSVLKVIGGVPLRTIQLMLGSEAFTIKTITYTGTYLI